jgi:hypothetical protein
MVTAKTGLPHDSADAGVIENRDEKLLHLDLNAQQGLMLLLLYTSSTLVRLRSLQSRDKRVGQ